MRRTRLRPDDASFDHTMALGFVREETWLHGNFDYDLLVAGNALDGDERSAGTDVDGGTKFEYGTAGGIGAVQENRKCDWQSLPAPRLIFGFSHGPILKPAKVINEITQVAGLRGQIHKTLVTFMRIRWLLLAIVFFAAHSWAAETPNFSGFWKMDVSKSDFGPQTSPQSAEYVIRHVGATISFNYTQDGKTSRVDLTPDNEERITSTTEETAVWTKSYWSGSVLVIESRERKRYGTQAGIGVGWTSRWSLSPDGQQLLIERKIHTPDGDIDQHVVCVKEPFRKSE